jgi:hypothetical protein
MIIENRYRYSDISGHGAHPTREHVRNHQNDDGLAIGPWELIPATPPSRYHPWFVLGGCLVGLLDDSAAEGRVFCQFPARVSLGTGDLPY